MDISIRMQDHAAVSRAAAAAGMVLLKNTGRTLPLVPETGERFPLAVFGTAQLLTPLGAEGMTPWRTVSILDGLCASDSLRPDGLLAHKYRAWVLEHPDGQELPLSDAVLDELTGSCAAAVVCIGRSAPSEDLSLRGEEAALLERVAARFSRTVLVLASPGYLDIAEPARQVGAVLWMGLAGQEGGHALADLLSARAVPSGHLASAWPADPGAFGRAAAQTDSFVGSRYFDSFGEEVLYPFGCGLSYGTVTLGSVSAGLDGCDVVVTAEAENTGSTYPAQELVQVYVSHPERADFPAQILHAYAKTGVLAPGQKQTLTLRFPVTELSVFHESASAFVLEEGFYDIRVGTNSRACCAAASIRVMRSAVVQAVTHLPFPPTQARTRPAGAAFTYPEEAEELAAARRRAIRFSDRDLPRQSRRKGREFSGCRADGQLHTFRELQEGRCSVFQLVASMEDESLRRLVYGFGGEPASVPGALGASAELPQYGIPAVQIAGGSMGLKLQKDVENEEGEIVRHQYTTLFPAASLLACSFDTEQIRAVGRAIGQEMREFGVGLWLAPGLELQRGPACAANADTWSEDPIVTGLCARALADGVRVGGSAVLGCADAPRQAVMSQSAWRDTWALPFEIAAGVCRVCLLPGCTLSGMPLCEDSALLRSILADWRYPGAFVCEAERYGAEPDRITLEKSALRILRALQALV